MPQNERADDGSRTRDLRLGKPTLYQLSYVRKGAWLSQNDGSPLSQLMQDGDSIRPPQATHLLLYALFGFEAPIPVGQHRQQAAGSWP